MKRFYVLERGEVFRLGINDQRTGEDMTADYMAYFAKEHGVSFTSFHGVDADEKGFDYRISGGSFEWVLDFLDSCEDDFAILTDYDMGLR